MKKEKTIGGEKGDRTLDLRLMSPALYQLSYLAYPLLLNGGYFIIFDLFSSRGNSNFLL